MLETGRLVASQIALVELDDLKQGIHSTHSNEVADEVSCITVESRGNLGADALFAVAQMDVGHCKSVGEAQGGQTRGVMET